MSRLLEIIGLFCKRALQKRRYSAKETYNLKEPTDRSHPVARYRAIQYHYRYIAAVLWSYGMATISRLLKIIGLFCRIKPLS